MELKGEVGSTARHCTLVILLRCVAMDAEELILCKHCNKEVAKANFELHEPHCARFLCVCPDCDETIPRDQLEEHKTEQHTQVKCQKCKKKMERRHLKEHETDECLERPECCEFCQLEMPLSSLMEHRLSCGSRTERCSDCGRYVKLTDQLSHSKICSATSPTLNSSSSEDEGSDKQWTFTSSEWSKSIPSDFLEEPMLTFKQSLQFERKKDLDFKKEHIFGKDSSSDAAGFSFSTYQKAKRDKNNEKDLDQIQSCPLCHLALPTRTLEWHEKKCGLHKHLSLAQ